MPAREVPMDAVSLVAVGLVAGLVSVVCGVGGGVVVVPALLWLRGMDVKAAVATSLAMIVPTAIVGALRKPPGLVDWTAAGILAIGAVAGAFAGEWVSGAMPAVWVKRVFAVLLVFVAVRLVTE
jgi:uncharacterized membrane protein YfcA